MRRFILSVLVCGFAASASALTPSTSNVFRPEQKPAQGEYQNPAGRIMGDTVADPFVITALPFTASGWTVGFANDYDAVCPYSGSTAPDVVYKFVATATSAQSIDLCASTYDTKLYVFENWVGNVIACSDDFCAFQSYIANVPFVAGNTYYIVVDGYGSSAGTYQLSLGVCCGCVIECPPDAMLEGEPECYDGYIDTYNGGLRVRHAALSRHGLVPDGRRGDLEHLPERRRGGSVLLLHHRWPWRLRGASNRGLRHRGGLRSPE
jgi:hypothetical protein